MMSSTRRRRFAFFTVVIATVFCVLAGALAPRPALAAGPLRRGVNVSGWAKPDGEAHIRLAAAAGFDHLRLPVDPMTLWDGSATVLLQPGPLSVLRQRVEMAQALGMAVIVDAHPAAAIKQRILADPAFATGFEAYWQALAAALAAVPDDVLYLEPLNEPGGTPARTWPGQQDTLLRAIRAVSPHRRLIAEGANASSPADMMALTPYHLDGVTYAFHFYAPMIFTHQGATWSRPYLRALHGVPYPVPATALQSMGRSLDDPAARDELSREAAGGDWGARRVAASLARVTDWSQRYRVPVICNEFGVFRNGGVAPAHRAAWLADVREGLERQGIGWTLWELSGGFGIVTPGGGVDPDMTTALGLRP
jgi:hypothetical protein